MELVEFAKKYFEKKDFKISKHQQKIIEAIGKGKKIILRTSRYAGRKTLNQMYIEFLKKQKPCKK